MTVFCTMMLCLCLIYIIECITPFILHQKLQAIATKYMYVIEKYGYLTKQEKDYLLEELASKGFNNSDIKLFYPKEKRSYGEVLELQIIYEYNSKIKPIPIIGMDSRELIVTKVSYSKI